MEMVVKITKEQGTVSLIRTDPIITNAACKDSNHKLWRYGSFV